MGATLKKYSGCIHWDMKRGEPSITWWPKQRRAWFTVQSWQAGKWIVDAKREITIRIQMILTKQVGANPNSTTENR